MSIVLNPDAGVTTPSPVVLEGSTSGTVTLAAPAVSGSSVITFPAGTGTVAVNGVSGVLVSGTAITLTNQTAPEFTDIPSWAKRITVMFNGVSTNGTSAYLIQLGDSGGIENTGYSSSASRISTSVLTQTSTAGFILFGGQSFAAAVYQGYFSIALIGSNTWVMHGTIADVTNTQTQVSCGSKSLSDTLTQLRIIASATGNPADTFDAGTINIMWE